MKISEGNFSRGRKDLADKQPTGTDIYYVENLLTLHLKSAYSRIYVWRFAVRSENNFLSQKDPPQKTQSPSRFPVNGRILSHFFPSQLLQSVCGIAIVIAAAILSHSMHYALCKTSLPLQVTIKVETLYKWPHFSSLTVD